jgi:hypothetical protein
MMVVVWQLVEWLELVIGAMSSRAATSDGRGEEEE